MPIPEAQKLIERAKKGEKLTSKDRRHAIAFLMATAPELTNVEMAKWFKITERMVRKDRQLIKEERAKLIREEDIGLVIADIAYSFDNQVRELEAGKKKASKGSRTHLEYCKAIFDMQLKKVKALQDLGYYPKNLGNMSIDKYDFIAVVNKQDGSVSSGRAVDMRFDGDDIIDAEVEEIKSLPAPAGEEVTQEAA